MHVMFNESGGLMTTHLPNHDRRWIAAQIAVFATALIAPVRLKRAPKSGTAALGRGLIGAVAIGAGAFVANTARKQLAEGLTMAPTPRAEGHMVDDGVYGVVRHPMYLSAVLIFAGWARWWGGPLSVIAPIGMLAFLLQKIAYEETRLIAHYPDYDAYRERVPNQILPGLI